MKSHRPRKGVKLFELTTRLKLRREEFGGLAFIPATGEILQIDSLGYKLLEKLLQEQKISSRPQEIGFWEELEKRGVVKEASNDEIS